MGDQEQQISLLPFRPAEAWQVVLGFSAQMQRRSSFRIATAGTHLSRLCKCRHAARSGKSELNEEASSYIEAFTLLDYGMLGACRVGSQVMPALVTHVPIDCHRRDLGQTIDILLTYTLCISSICTLRRAKDRLQLRHLRLQTCFHFGSIHTWAFFSLFCYDDRTLCRS